MSDTLPAPVAQDSTLADLASLIRFEHEQFRLAAHKTVEHGFRVGEALLQAKRRIRHGRWGRWIEEHCDLSERTAQGYMRLARNRAAIEANPQALADLTIEGALQSLAKPKPAPEIGANSDGEHGQTDDGPTIITTVGTVRKKMEATGDLSKLDRRTDRKGHKRPAHEGVVHSVVVDHRQKGRAEPAHMPQPNERPTRPSEHVLLSAWNEMGETERVALLARIEKKTLNKQSNTDIEWAGWSWNPITGCLHECPYCYARDIAVEIYPEEVGFLPTLWPDRLTAPQNQKLPKDADQNISQKNIFTCSMADLFGRWVPKEWIERVLAEVAANPEWNFLFLTKFPKRMSEFVIPPNAWMGTTVDLQARVANAEKAFEQVKATVRWLSIEPMLEPLKFTRLDLFDWIVIGGASPSKAVDGTPDTPVWNIPVDWIVDLHQQARAAGCKIFYKTNSGLSDLTRVREYPGHESAPQVAPKVFHYLGKHAETTPAAPAPPPSEPPASPPIAAPAPTPPSAPTTPGDGDDPWKSPEWMHRRRGDAAS
jgi:protein gp37